MTVTFHSFVRTNALLGSDFIEKMNEFIRNEKDKEIKRRLKQTLSWNELNYRF